MNIYFTQDGATVSYAFEKSNVENDTNCDAWRAKFKVKDFDMQAAIKALECFKSDMRATFGASVVFIRVDYNGAETIV